MITLFFTRRYVGTNAERIANIGFENGDEFRETDTNHLYQYDFDAWHIINHPNIVLTQTLTDTGIMLDTVEEADLNKGTAATLTLPTHKVNKRIYMVNKGAGTWTLTPTSGLIKGSATASLLTAEDLTVKSDGTNWI